MTQAPVARVSSTQYGCAYDFTGGTIAVSVTTNRTTAAARDQLAAIAAKRGRRPEPPMLGESLETFVTTDGSTIVRHGRDVLDVDVGGLPAEFGRPPVGRSVVARAVVVTILGHWVPG